MCITCGCGVESGENEHPDHGVGAHSHPHEHGGENAPHGEHRHPEHDPTGSELRRENEHPRSGDRPLGTNTAQLERALLAKNDELAAKNREWLALNCVTAINLIGAPGAGKTSLLEATLEAFGGEPAVSVVEGDQATDRDSQRIAKVGGRVFQVNTRAGCHLDASMIEKGIEVLEPAPSSVLFIENVGNLVCPARFDLGEQTKVVVLSVTEGEDKPIKYPHVFRAAKALVLTKVDLLKHTKFDIAECVAHARAINPGLRIMGVSALSGYGIHTWCRFVRQRAKRVLQASREQSSKWTA